MKSMIKVHHLNCVKIEVPINDRVIGHCLLLQEGNKLALVDAGIGVLDTLHPETRIGKQLIEMAGFKFDESLTALRQIEALGLDPDAVTDIVISHLDPDHIGGLADFPNAAIHVAEEELRNFHSGKPRYLAHQLAHSANIVVYPSSSGEWFGFEARRVALPMDIELYLVPLFGHTLGHCGIALKEQGQWLFYIGDAYYMRVELDDQTHPVNQLAQFQADDNNMRLDSLERIRQLLQQHPEVKVFGYHDVLEYETFVREPQNV